MRSDHKSAQAIPQTVCPIGHTKGTSGAGTSRLGTSKLGTSGSGTSRSITSGVGASGSGTSNVGTSRRGLSGVGASSCAAPSGSEVTSLGSGGVVQAAMSNAVQARAVRCVQITCGSLSSMRECFGTHCILDRIGHPTAVGPADVSRWRPDRSSPCLGRHSVATAPHGMFEGSVRLTFLRRY